MALPITADYHFQDLARILGLPQAIAPGQPVTFEQLAAAIEAIKWKTDDLDAMSTANINLAAPGPTIDTVTMSLNMRFGAKDQSSLPQNGIYIWNGAGVPATRAPDASTFEELESAVVQVRAGGAVNGGTTWRQTQVGGVIGTNNIVWAPFGTTTPSASETVEGKAEIGTQPEVDLGLDDTRIVTALKLANWIGKAKRFADNFGDGSSTSFNINHNLGTLDVTYKVMSNATGGEVQTEITGRTINQITIASKPAPTVDALRVTVVA